MAFPFRRKSSARKRATPPARLALYWFASFVLVGTVLLRLPWSHAAGGPGAGFSAALFTAVSAACVTGLSVVDVPATFNIFGQFIIAALLEMGGIGVMTFAHLGFRLFGRRASIAQQAALADSLFQSDAAREFGKSFRQIVKVTLCVQLVGALSLLVSALPRHLRDGDGFWRAAWAALFHSISAFCNGGFMVYPVALGGVSANIPFLAAILALITLGGLGHGVLVELSRLPALLGAKGRKPRLLSLNARVVLVTTAAVILAGIAGVWLFGAGAGVSRPGGAVFQVMSGRTAGFAIVPVANMPLPSLLIMIALMFIGGSPGSCAGGIKTTSLAIWIAGVRANLRNDSKANLFGYVIAPDLVSRARILMALTMLWNLAGIFVLVVLHPRERLETLIFEQISAFGTVGLSMDFTPRLTVLSRLWIMLSMFVGRLGPLSIALWMAPAAKLSINRPVGRVMVG